MIDPERDLLRHSAPAGLLESAVRLRQHRIQRRRATVTAAAALCVGLVGGWGMNEALTSKASPLVIASHSDVPVQVRLVLHAPDASRVTVAGSFNGWQADQNPLTQSEDGLWHTVVTLPRGRYEYQFVLDGSTWVADPTAELSVPDDFGQRNAVLDV